MNPLHKYFLSLLLIMCLSLVCLNAFAAHNKQHYFFEVSIVTDTNISQVDSSVITFNTNTLFKEYGDSLICRHVLLNWKNSDTVFIGVSVDTDSTLSAILADGYDTMTCGEVQTNAKVLFVLNSIPKFICD